MPNNFREIPSVGGFYVSKDGDDATAVAYNGSNLETARDNPRKTLPTSNLFHVVGAGYYLINQIDNVDARADGIVVIDGENQTLVTSSIATRVFIGFVFRNFSRLDANNQCVNFIECTVENPNYVASVFGGAYSEHSIFKSSDGSHRMYLGKATTGNNDFNNTFYNTRISVKYDNGGSPRFDKNACVRDDGGVCLEVLNGNTTAIVNCAFKGQIIVNGTTYSGFSDPDLATEYPDFVANQGNFEVTQDLSACFNNAQSGDFSLKITSQLIKETYNVGAKEFRFAKYIDVDPELSPPALQVNPLTAGTGFKFREVKAGESNVQFTTDAFLADPINSNIAIVDLLEIVNELNFNTDEAADEPTNQNVPNVENFLSGTSGANPKRLTFEFRTSRNNPSDKPDADEDWDNSFNGIAAGTWIKHELNNQVAVVDALGRGKGDPDYDPSIPELEFVAVWLQFRITLRRDHTL